MFYRAFAVAAFYFFISQSAYAFSGSGTGTALDPYQIRNVTQLQEMENDLTAHYILMNNIDASGTSSWNSGKGFDPVGIFQAVTITNSFTGSLNGQGYTISDLTIDRDGENFVGLFGCVADGAEIYDVNLTGAYVTADDYAGMLVGVAYAYNSSGVVEIRDCSVSGQIIGTDNYGGLVGLNYAYDGETTVSNCQASVQIAGSGDCDYVGGLCGWNYAHRSGSEAEIYNCSSSGTLYNVIDVTSVDRIGGLCGYNYADKGTARISYSSSSASVGTDNAAYFFGGFCGENYADEGTASINYCSSTGNVNGFAYGGGFCGRNKADVSNSEALILYCESSGDVSGSTDTDGSSHGGFCGMNGGAEATGAGRSKILYCRSEGDVLGYDYIGGFCGRVINYGGTGTTVYIGNCEALGDAEGRDYVGGFVGQVYAYNAGTGTSSYVFDCRSLGDADGGLGVGGFVGVISAATGGEAEIERCYSVGVPTGSIDVGGFCGELNTNAGTVNITNSFWDETTSGTTDGVGDGTEAVTGCTTTQMQTYGNFVGWSFTSDWFMQCSSYPVLRDVSKYSGSGSGTQGDPYQVSDVCDLQEMILEPDAHYVLTNNIDASATSSWAPGFEPIGQYSSSDATEGFTGSLNGKGFTISSLAVDRGSANVAGLFGCISDGATVRDVHLTGADIFGNEKIGVLAGIVFAFGDGSEVNIIDCSAAGTVSGDEYVGGFVGRCHADSGSIVIKRCSTTASVIGDGADKYYIGGFAGGIYSEESGSRSLITECEATGSVDGSEFVGGFCGNNTSGNSSSNASIISCSSSGEVTGDGGSEIYIGGFCGNNYTNFGLAYIANCKSDGNVSGATFIGGFCAKNTSYSSGALAQIENCFCKASVGGANYVGGFIAQNGTYFGGAASIIADCYCVSPVTSTGTEGCFCDDQSGIGTMTISSCYWDNDVESDGSNGLGTPKTTLQMKTESTFSGWDFNDVWSLDASVNDGYPELQSLADCKTNYSTDGDDYVSAYVTQTLRATDDISLAGSSNSFLVEVDGSDAGTLRLVAGESVTLLPGFKAESGSSVHAVISGSACDYSFSRKVEKEYVYERSESDGELRLWPNPAQNRIYFEYPAGADEKIGYEIISAIGGERIAGSELASGSAWEDISDYPAGVYFLRVSGPDKVKIVKFIKAD